MGLVHGSTVGAGDTIRCDDCGTLITVNDRTPLSQAVELREHGWTSPSPFTDTCPACTARTEAVR